tara:strand:- start:954 stop:1376 length:423 start_codon:yes stop_codon:yes gene_type:complete
MNNSKVIFFDGECNLCNAIVDFIANHNQKRDLNYVSLQSDFAKERLLVRGINNITNNTIYYDDGNKLYVKSQAVFMVFKNLDGLLYPFFGKIGLLLPRFISDYVYNIISRNRYVIMGKRDTCRIKSDVRDSEQIRRENTS